MSLLSNIIATLHWYIHSDLVIDVEYEDEEIWMNDFIHQIPYCQVTAHKPSSQLFTTSINKN